MKRASEHSVEEPQKSPIHHSNLIVTEDNAINRRVIVKLLPILGYGEADGKELLEAIDAEKPQIGHYQYARAWLQWIGSPREKVWRQGYHAHSRRITNSTGDLSEHSKTLVHIIACS